MKRKIISSLILLLLIVLGVSGYEYFGKAESKKEIWGFSKSYNTLEELIAEADLVVRVHIPLYFDIQETDEEGQIIKQAFYEGAIDEVFYDRTGHDYDDESEIIVSQVIGLKDSSEETDYKFKGGMRPIKTGEYLLFLNKETHLSDGKIYYVSNSPHHLYKRKGKKTFRNIASDELKEIQYSELTDGI